MDCSVCGKDVDNEKEHMSQFHDAVEAYAQEKSKSELNKEIKDLINFINIASMENPMHMGEYQEKLEDLKNERALLGEVEYEPSEEPIGGDIENGEKTIGLPEDKRSYDVENDEDEISDGQKKEWQDDLDYSTEMDFDEDGKLVKGTGHTDTDNDDSALSISEAEYEPSSSFFDANIEPNGEITQDLPEDKRSYDVENEEEEGDDELRSEAKWEAEEAMDNYEHEECGTSLLMASPDEASKFKCDVCGKSFAEAGEEKMDKLSNVIDKINADNAPEGGWDEDDKVAEEYIDEHGDLVTDNDTEDEKKDAEEFGDYDTKCDQCDGTGKDELTGDGVCPRCDGSGKSEWESTTYTGDEGYEDDDLDKKAEIEKEEKKEIFEENWHKKTFNSRVEAFESIGFEQGDSLKLADLELEDLSEEVKGALEVEDIDKEEKREDATTAFNEEGDQPNTQITEEDEIDYNIIAESQTNRTKYECEHCNSGFKSNEALMTHFNDIHIKANEFVIEVPHKCVFCGKDLDEDTTMGEHLAYDHGIETHYGKEDESVTMNEEESGITFNIDKGNEYNFKIDGKTQLKIGEAEDPDEEWNEITKMAEEDHLEEEKEEAKENVKKKNDLEPKIYSATETIAYETDIEELNDINRHASQGKPWQKLYEPWENQGSDWNRDENGNAIEAFKEWECQDCGKKIPKGGAGQHQEETGHHNISKSNEEFNEDEHPRDSDGKFGSDGTSSDTSHDNPHTKSSIKDIIKSIKGGSKDWHDWGRNEKTEDAYAEIENRNRAIPRPSGRYPKIFRDDPDAVSKMEQKIKVVEEEQAYWKQITKFPNRDYQNHSQLGDAKWYEMSLTSTKLREAKKKLEGIKAQQARGTTLTRKPTYTTGKKRFYYSEDPKGEVLATEALRDSWWWKDVTWESGFDQDFMTCNHCGRDMFNIAFDKFGNVGDDAFSDVVPEHLKSHNITEVIAMETTIDKCLTCGRTADNHANPNTDYRGLRGDAPATDHYYHADDDGVESYANEEVPIKNSIGTTVDKRGMLKNPDGSFATGDTYDDYLAVHGINENMANEDIDYDECPDCKFETAWKKDDDWQEGDAKREMDTHKQSHESNETELNYKGQVATDGDPKTYDTDADRWSYKQNAWIPWDQWFDESNEANQNRDEGGKFSSGGGTALLPEQKAMAQINPHYDAFSKDEGNPYTSPMTESIEDKCNSCGGDIGTGSHAGNCYDCDKTIHGSDSTW